MSSAFGGCPETVRMADAAIMKMNRLLHLIGLGISVFTVTLQGASVHGEKAEPAALKEANAAETVLFYGGALVERLQEEGTLEALLQTSCSGGSLKVRSLAWTGDEIGNRLRPEGYAEHLKGLLELWPASTVVLGFGNNESFGGEDALPQFRKDWEMFLREVRRLHPRARLVMLSPVAVDGVDLEYVRLRNRVIRRYAEEMREIALREGILFVDLFEEIARAFSKKPGELVERGGQLNAQGLRVAAECIALKMLGGENLHGVDESMLSSVARAAAQKSRFVADVVRPKNGVVYFGVRKRPEENAAELPRYHQLISLADDVIHELVRHPEKRFEDYPRPTLPPLEMGKSVPDRYSGGVVKEPLEQIKDLRVADGYEVNLFASEADFPDLKNPVQMAFDARGRLWVVTMPSFPHTVPGEVPKDKILILEDTHHTGKADKCTVFAEGFDALDGVAFHESGVVVSAQPRILVLRDTDGDGKADTQEELLRGVDVTDSHHGGMVAVDPVGHVMFSDGVFHRSQFETPFGVVRGIDSTVYRLNPRNGRVSREWQSLTPNPWKMAFDGYGNLFQRYGGGHVLDSLPLSWTPLGVYHPYGNGMVLNYAKGSGTCVVSSPNFPDKYQQGIVSTSLLGSYSVSMAVAEAGEGPVVGVDRVDLLSSENSAFRPVDVSFGFDGALYVSDFASRIIGHAQHPMRDPQWNHTKGRIWRVTMRDRPVVNQFPSIEGTSVPALLKLLLNEQDVVREQARVELRKHGRKVVPLLDEWVRGADMGTRREYGLLEASWLMIAFGELRGGWVEELLRSSDARMRAAAVQLVRLNGGRLPESRTLLRTAARDDHPRVRMAVINAVSHLRSEQASEADFARVHALGSSGHAHAGKSESWEETLSLLNAQEAPVSQMLGDLKAGLTPRKGRSVPVLEMNPASKVLYWLAAGETGGSDLGAYPTNADQAKSRTASVRTRFYKTYVESKEAQGVLLNVRHGYVDVSVNGVQLLSTDSPYSSNQQVQFELKPGLNVLEMAYRKLPPKGSPPPVFVCDMSGQIVEGAVFPQSESQLGVMAAAWDALHATEAGMIRIQAVPNMMKFSPAEVRVRVGQAVKLVFENPDLMQHNLVVVKPDTDEEVGLLADQMAGRVDGATRHFVPDSKQVLFATPLVNPGGRAELEFKAPSQPGVYSYLCTFPGHWRVMRGQLVVE